MKKIKIDTLSIHPARVGESPVWCGRNSCLWWVDIGRCELHCYTPADNTDRKWSVPGKIGCVALTQSEDLLLALTGGLYRFNLKKESLAHIENFHGEPEGNRPNDGAVSRSGHFFVGSMPMGDRSIPTGRLYLFDGNRIDCRLEGLHVSNGLAFSPDDQTAYLSDSWPDVQTIWAFDHDPDDGALTNRRVFFDARVTKGRPDGACIDTDGCYWMAGVGGSEVLRLTPKGEIDLRIDLPVTKPTKPCFGGNDLRTLFITSIGIDAKKGKPDGCILALNTGYSGLPEGRCRITSLS